MLVHGVGDDKGKDVNEVVDAHDCHDEKEQTDRRIFLDNDVFTRWC